ncbi:ATP-binding protein [Salinibacterium sp. SYSU T00001]|uniref:sensor histidine kinase n=1 Tax=Homoserinimonas sedimenticola TaxID=2986805 RepID=UPI002235EC31|nr:ATP-binding protein [Salinibacterium sedimenticola]MCW4386456.1 ATP-binding protein [Salinibacterium sedimenticola]
MPPRVPPRSIAAGFRLQAVTRAGWVLAALVLLEHAIVTIEYFLRVDRPQQMVLPVLTIVCVATALAILALSPHWSTGILYLGVGVAAICVYIALMVEAKVVPEQIILVGTVGTAVGLVGAMSGGALGGAIWTFCAALLAQAAVMGTQLVLGVPVTPDSYALIIASVYLVTYLAMWRNDRMGSRIVNTEPIVAEVEREEHERHRERQAAVVVHETVLRDLALIAHGPLQLTDFDRVRLRRDLDEIRAWRTEPANVASPTPRDDFYDIIREFQWRGLSVDVGGSSYALEQLGEADREALLGAVRAALDNVLEHSGETRAEVFIDQGLDRLTVMIVDEGRGFHLDEVAEDRLGLRMAIMRRIEDHGGSATVWASPGAGTSVVISLPVDDGAGVYA